MEYFEESFVRWTVRLSVVCYLFFCLLKLAPGSSSGFTSSKRLLGTWTLGLIFFLLHFVSSMSFAHDWSHEDAVTHTAEQTEAMTGWNWGGGIYFNYLFALIWLFDVVMWYKTGPSWLENRIYQIGLHSFFAFIVFNATIVFGPRYWWAIGGVFLSALVLLFVVKKKQRGV